MNLRNAFLSALAAVVLVAPEAVAQRAPAGDIVPSSHRAPDIVPSRPLATANARTSNPKTGPLSHLDDTLQDLAALAQTNARVASSATVGVDVIATSEREAEALQADLVALGFQPSGRAGIVISGRLPVTAIEAAAALPALRSAMVPQYIRRRAEGGSVALPSVVNRVGSVEGEASVALRADDARSTFGVDGSGVCIGVLSDSYDNLGGAAAGVASGDLPAGVNVLDDYDAGTGIDEGRAMMELAYDVAPGVTFGFHTAFEGYASFAGGVVDLYLAGCQVVVDDIGISTDPFFQDGAIAQAVDHIVSQGGLYFSSAGNSADASYEADFQDSGETGFFGGELHDFDPGPGVDAFQAIEIWQGEVLRFAFQYDEPSILAGVEVSEYPALYGGAPGQAPTSDYDVWVLDAPSFVTGNILGASINSNPTYGAPYEFIQYQNLTGEIQTIYVAIEKYDGEDRRLKYINFGGDEILIQTAEHATLSSTVFGHSNAEGTFATAASAWFNTDQWNASVAANPGLVGAALVNGFSSYGGLEVRLDINGDPLPTPEDRGKPDATSSDGDNNTFFGADSGADADANPNFFGTSAAAPNAAAVAALMIEATGGSVTPTDAYDALETTAADILEGSVYNAGAVPGFDYLSGHGLLRADLAVAEVAGGDAVACSPSEPLSFADFDADGTDATYGEFAAIANGGDEAVDLSTCTFVAFNPFTEKVTYAASTDGTVPAGDDYVLATTNGDQALPAGSLFDGPGAIALVVGDVAPGATVADVLANVVAAVVYFNDNMIVGSVGGGGNAARTASKEEVLRAALAEVRASVAAAPVDLEVTAAPNPVSGALTVQFGAEEVADVRASIYDALGREVAVLADGSFGAGRHEVAFDASALPAGVYVVRVSVGTEARTARVTVVR